MPITFNSEGGFLNGTISSSNGDIFVTTSGSVGAINLGQQLQLTGSDVIEKDINGNVRNKKTFNSDGTITQQKFDQNGIVTETKVKDPTTGREFARSGSSVDNQIEFKQNSQGAFITVSGSIPGFNIVETSGDTDTRLLRAQYDLLIRDNESFTVGINPSLNYQISPGVAFSNGLTIDKDNSNVEVVGSVSSSGFIGGGTQNTGSYDFPGAIMGYNVQGLNVTHASYDLTTSMAVPDAGMNVCFVAPKSGIVEIEVQVLADGGSSGVADLTLGLSDNASYNAVQTYYEQNVLGFPRFDHMNVIHKWVVTGLTVGTTYQYWLGAKSSNTTGTPTLKWGGSTSGRNSDFIMKATALPSNTEIET
tara:strand:+ start:3287 stop:4372 length:1086 start_codon:yes stop_codon:yes gene_type:complete